MPRQRDTDSNKLSLLLKYISNSDIISNPRPIEIQSSPVGERGAVAIVEVDVQIEGQSVTLQIGLDALFPHSLPIISIIPWNRLGFIPHVEPNGYVCYAQREGLLLNRHNFKGILDESIRKTISVLISGYRGENRNDFIDEFEAYWCKLSNVRYILSVIEPTDDLRQIIAAKKEDPSIDEEPYIYVTDDVKSIQSFYNLRGFKQYTHRNALYIPFKPGTFVCLPPPNSQVNSDFFQDLIKTHLTKTEQKTLKRLVRKPKREEIVIFRLPRPSGGEVLFGVLFEDINGAHPLLPGGTANKIFPLVVLRRDKSFLLPRGGANKSLQEKRVILLGCGSVGGFIAFNLVRSGILDITLVDHDILTAENTFRHVLGKSQWGKPKVEALKEELQEKFPYVRITSYQMTAQDALLSGLLVPKTFDLIIVAIGDDTISLYINEILHAQKGIPPVVFTWLEPYGIGGHVLITNNSSSSGCFECLFTPVPGDDTFIMGNRAAFAAPKQAFSKDISGCANHFTPFGSQDAQRTAALATRQAIQVLLGRVSGNPLVSWKGDPTEFLAAGFRLAPRYHQTEEELIKFQFKYRNSLCPICSLNLRE